MSALWPQLPEVAAAEVYGALAAGRDPESALEHPAQVWSPVGGRVEAAEIRSLAEGLTSLAQDHGYPGATGIESRIAFDRAAAQTLREYMNLDWAEAGKRDVWSFTALVLLPHLTTWRFGTENRERWVATDLTRHTWARLWWQAVVFTGHENLLRALSESDLNQLLERRSIGGDPRLVCAFAESILSLPRSVARRPVIRNATMRLLRWMAFMDLASVSYEQIRQTTDRAVGETLSHLQESLSLTDGLADS